MITINWDEFKEFKKHRHNKDDNFGVLLDFMKSYYNIISAADMYDTLKNDGLSEMMLEKREIKDAEGLEYYLFKPAQ
jgi:hypothetical protein